MSDSPASDIHFLNQLDSIIEKNLVNEQFGVTELAEAMNMSRSNLLRKVKKSTRKPVNQLIREARLKRAMLLLQNTASNVSEISRQVGFNSTSYFIKCFREHYGYPPGEAGKRAPSEITPDQEVGSNRRKHVILAVLTGLAILSAVLFYYYMRAEKDVPEQSIVVLPFKNESNDSTNVYLINGLMESTLNNLQKIEALRVLSRTTSEKYRNTTKSISEMAGELNADYFVEGSGQKIGNQILLNIQLIEGATDKHIWAKQYRREAKDIFALQQELAKNIAEEIQVIISPEARSRIEKIPTQNLEAYDAYLKGKEFFYQSTGESLREAMDHFRKAIALDDKFGLAYAHLVMTEYYMDIFTIRKNYTEEIVKYADNAMLFDPQSGESLIAKALAYAYKKEYKPAVLYLEKALEYNSHSSLVLHFLTEFYSLYVPDPGKYVEYSLMRDKEDRVTLDSASLGFRYFNLANALMQAGFIDEGIHYVEQSLAYDPNGFYSRYVSVLFRFAKNRDLDLTRQLLLKEFEKDTTRADIEKELGKFCYLSRDYKSAYLYYKGFLSWKERLRLEIFNEEYLNISLVYAQMGEEKLADEYRKKFKEFADSNQSSIYLHLFRGLYFSNTGETKKAIEELDLFSKENNFQYWVLLVEDDPLVDPLKNIPEFKVVIEKIKKRFWDNHKKIRDDLEDKGLYPFEEYLK